MSGSLNIKTLGGFSQVNKMRACESLTTNGSCMIIQGKQEMFYRSSSVNTNTKTYKTIKMRGALRAINSA